jgi:hypothetical protein
MALVLVTPPAFGTTTVVGSFTVEAFARFLPAGRDTQFEPRQIRLWPRMGL